MNKISRLLAVLLVAISTLYLIGCSSANKGDTYRDYIKSAMDASYLGEFDEYMELSDVTQSEAEELYESEVEYFAYCLMYYNQVESDIIDEEIIEQYRELAKELYKKTKYTVNSGNLVDGIYQVKVEISPIDIWDITYDAVVECIEDFQETYTSDIVSEMTEEEYIQIENEYAQDIYEILYSYVDQVGYKDTITRIVEIQTDSETYYVKDDDWSDLDDYVIDLK